MITDRTLYLLDFYWTNSPLLARESLDSRHLHPQGHLGSLSFKNNDRPSDLVRLRAKRWSLSVKKFLRYRPKLSWDKIWNRLLRQTTCWQSRGSRKSLRRGTYLSLVFEKLRSKMIAGVSSSQNWVLSRVLETEETNRLHPQVTSCRRCNAVEGWKSSSLSCGRIAYNTNGEKPHQPKYLPRFQNPPIIKTSADN